MTKTKSKNSANNDNQEIRTGFYGSMVNPRYTSTVIDSGAVLTADMLTRAAEKACTTSVYKSTGLMSDHALKYLQEKEEMRILQEKLHSSPVGELLK